MTAAQEPGRLPRGSHRCAVGRAMSSALVVGMLLVTNAGCAGETKHAAGPSRTIAPAAPPFPPVPCPSIPAMAAPFPAAKTAASHACTLFDKSIVGWTMKEAVFEPEMVGGTQGDRELAERDPLGWDRAFWSCVVFAKASKGSWCECPRGPGGEGDRAFEKQMEKTQPVVWTSAIP